MTAHELEVLSLTSSTPKTSEPEEEYSIPLDISDILSICKEYTKLTWQMQNQIESILEVGIEESIKSGSLQRISLPHIKNFLLKICDNPYFGDAASQAHDCIKLIQQYEDKNRLNIVSNLN